MFFDLRQVMSKVLIDSGSVQTVSKHAPELPVCACVGVTLYVYVYVYVYV